MKHGFIGFGNVAKAIYKGLSSNREHSFSYFSKRSSSAEIHRSTSLLELKDFADVLWLCVKPQDLTDVLDELRKVNLNDEIVVSPVAGKPIIKIEESIGANVCIVRIMPNLAIAYQQSVTAFCSNNIEHIHLNSLKSDLRMMGKVVEIGEIHFDLYTAIFGSGPAFLLSVFEVFKKKIIDMKIKDSDAQDLLVELLKGTTTYLEMNKQMKISELIKNVTSKGGTTEAGLNYSKEHDLEKTIENVLIETEKKSKVLL